MAVLELVGDLVRHCYVGGKLQRLEYSDGVWPGSCCLHLSSFSLYAKLIGLGLRQAHGAQN